ncbi:NifB/NifX family molybdenum-iron cluster-binding protein [Planctomycetota bacterium]
MPFALLTIMKIALPAWMEFVSPVFDTARRILVVESKNDQEVARFELAIEELSLPLRVEKLAASGADVLICGAISKPFAKMISGKGIEVIPFITGNVEEVLNAYFSGRLSEPGFFMPGSSSIETGNSKKTRKVTVE